MQLNCSFPPLEEPATGHYNESEKSGTNIPSFFSTISVFPAIHICIIEVVSLIQVFLEKIRMHFFTVLCVLRSPPFSYSLI
jgi:hypothetical protein